MNGITDRLIKGSLWLSFSRMIVNALATLSTLVLAWYLTPADFGLVALGTTMLAIVTTVTELSLTQALIRHEAPQESHLSTAWTLNAARGLIICLFFTACAWPAAAIYEEPRLVGVMLALAFGVLLSGLKNPRLVMLQRQLIFWQEFVLSVAQKLAGFLASVAVAVIYQSYWALVVGVLATQAVNLITSYMVLPFRPRICFRHTRELFSYSAWLSAGLIVNTLNWRFDHLLIGKVLGAGALGHYTLGSNLARTPTRESTTPLTRTIFPSFASIGDDPPRLAAAYQRVQALVTAIALPAGVGLAVVADLLVRIAFGEKWLPMVFIVQSLSCVYALQTLGSLVQPLGMAKGETRLLFVRDTQMLLVRVPVIVAGLLLYGLPGVIIGRVFTGLLAAFVNMMLVRRLIGVTVARQLGANLRALVSVAVMAAGVILASTYLPHAEGKVGLAIRLAELVMIGGVTYCGVMVLMWLAMKRPPGPEVEVRRILAKLLAKLKPSATFS